MEAGDRMKEETVHWTEAPRPHRGPQLWSCGSHR